MSQETEVLTKEDFEFVHRALQASKHYKYSVAGTPDRGMPCFQRLFEKEDDVWFRIYECVLLLDFSYSTNLNKGGKNSLFLMTTKIKEHSKQLRRLKDGSALSDGDLDKLVKELAPIETKVGGERNNFSFATKFCAQLAPKRCPIYDAIVAKALGTWRGRGGQMEMKHIRKDKDYKAFLDIYREFQRAHARGLTFREIDWILWFAWENRPNDFFEEERQNYKACFEELHEKVRRICKQGAGR